MPEGPEIRRVADELEKQVAGRVIDRLFFGLAPLKRWQKKLSGASIEKIETYGKAMVIHLLAVDKRRFCIYSHNQLYGRWHFCNTNDYPDNKRKLRIAIDCQERAALLYSASDISVFRQEELQQHAFIKKLGPDVLKKSTTMQQVVARLNLAEYKNCQLGRILTDQTFVAGLGNYLRCEILFYCGLHPKIRSRDLDDTTLHSLASTILKLARQSYQTGGITNNLKQVKQLVKQGASFEVSRFYVFRREGLHCYRCSAVIVKKSQAGKSCYYCPQCQA